MKTIPLSLLFVLNFLVTGPAHAGEGFFSRLYTTDTDPKGTWEVEEIVRNRRDRSHGSYSAFDFRTELEYGFTDAFQGSLYFNLGHMAAVNSPDDDDPNGRAPGGFSRNSWFVQSISAEFIYRIFSPITDPVGLAIYFEPAYDWHDLHNGLSYDKTFENEWRLILQKNFFDDTLIVALNTIAEFEFVRFEGEEDYKGELDWNNEIGATYRFTSNWFAGLEARNHNEIGNFKVHEHSVYWAGPSIHYGGQKFWATLGMLYQVAGNPHGVDPEGVFLGEHTFLRSHERWEITAKLGIPFTL